MDEIYADCGLLSDGSAYGTYQLPNGLWGYRRWLPDCGTTLSRSGTRPYASRDEAFRVATRDLSKPRRVAAKE